ncbi:hypothetical protein [Saccharomonospora iraqiensis]|uniref:hypothetical protein n=1 Tax=Saccharomonospora iraqiensis TaxID=52698 RepID=UPI00030965BD|nr:hypothetical protein [Saccharomonospora iraqiensis]
MGEHHAEGRDTTADTTRAMPASSAGPDGRPPEGEAESGPRPKRRTDWHAARDRGVELLATLVRWVGLAFAVVLVLHVVFVVGEANPDNGIVSFVADAAERLALGFEDMFVPDDPQLAVLLNHGLAAVFWLVASSLVTRIIRLVGGAGRS